MFNNKCKFCNILLEGSKIVLVIHTGVVMMRWEFWISKMSSISVSPVNSLQFSPKRPNFSFQFSYCWLQRAFIGATNKGKMNEMMNYFLTQQTFHFNGDRENRNNVSSWIFIKCFATLSYKHDNNIQINLQVFSINALEHFLFFSGVLWMSVWSFGMTRVKPKVFNCVGPWPHAALWHTITIHNLNYDLPSQFWNVQKWRQYPD